MKRCLAMLCVVLLCSTLFTGCKRNPDLTVFNDWLTNEGFTPSLTEKSMLFKISNYTYLGKNLTAENIHDENLGEGNAVGSTFWGLNSNSTTENGSVHSYLHFYVQKNLDNLQFPGGVRIGDSMADCLSKLDLTDKKQNVSGIKIGSKTCELSLNGGILIYKENYDWYRNDGKMSAVTRSVMMKFESDVLAEVSVTISQRYAE